MRTDCQRRLQDNRGVALVVVLWVIMVLSLLIGGFAFTMHVETQIASYNRKQLKAEMLARSGVEVARMLLMRDAQSATTSTFDATTDPWATNAEFYAEHPLGEGTVSVKVTDEESKLPLNRLSPEQWQRLMEMLAVDPSEGDVVVDSILDWMDENDMHRLNGAETDYYSTLSPPYKAKNGRFDRVEELLLLRGMTDQIFYGSPATEEMLAMPGLRDVLSTHTSTKVNINTATPIVLQVVMDLDDVQIQTVTQRRDGQDGLPGTEDDQPFRTVTEFASLLGPASSRTRQRQLQVLGVLSTFFTIKATGDVGGVKSTITTLVQRQGDKLTTVTWNQTRSQHN